MPQVTWHRPRWKQTQAFSLQVHPLKTGRKERQGVDCKLTPGQREYRGTARGTVVGSFLAPAVLGRLAVVFAVDAEGLALRQRKREPREVWCWADLTWAVR